MKAADLFAALMLPANTRVDQRVPKKLLVEHGAPTAADKRQINEGIEELVWLATLKPTTIGVPVYQDAVREYLEIAVLSLVLRPSAKIARLSELVHRAVPYPVLLLLNHEDRLSLSLAHKRRSQSETDKTVLDGDLVTIELANLPDRGLLQSFLGTLALARQPRTTLYALYQGWIDAVVALQAAQVTGAFTTAASPQNAAARHTALREWTRIDADIAALRTRAAKEKQIARRVDLNLEIRRLEAKRSGLLSDL